MVTKRLKVVLFLFRDSFSKKGIRDKRMGEMLLEIHGVETPVAKINSACYSNMEKWHVDPKALWFYEKNNGFLFWGRIRDT